MTYPELKIALDINDPEVVLSSLIDQYNSLKYCGCYFIVCDDGDVHCFDKQGREQKIDNIPNFCFANQFFKKIIIPKTVTSIGGYAFENCSGLSSVTIPNNTTSIRKGAFEHCSGLTSVHITDLAKWCGISFGDSTANPLYYAHNLYLNGEFVTDLTIPNSMTTIGHYAFSGCSGLTSVTIPDSVTNIGMVRLVDAAGLRA